MSQDEEKILALKEQLDDLLRVEEYYKELTLKIDKEKKHLKQLEYIAELEYQDILDLEKKTFVDFFIDYSIEREKQKEKEQDEYLAAVMDCRNLARAIKGLEFQAGILEEKVKGIPDLKMELHLLLNLREGKLKKTTLVPSVKKAGKASSEWLNKIFTLIDNAKEIELRLLEINTCLDRIATWGVMNKRYSEDRRRHILRDVSNLESVLVWLRSDMIQLETKINTLHQKGHLQELVSDGVMENFEKVYTRFTKQIQRFMSAIVDNTIMPSTLADRCTVLKSLAKSFEYELKQVFYYLE